MEDVTAEINMKQYIKECIEVFGEDIVKGANTPVKHNLFMIGDSDSLSEKMKDLSHQIVGKMMYIFKRIRVDINWAVSFQCARVSCSTKEDWKNLRRLLNYLYGTVNMSRIIGVVGHTKKYG